MSESDDKESESDDKEKGFASSFASFSEALFTLAKLVLVVAIAMPYSSIGRL
jgi:hypothetical protein